MPCSATERRHNAPRDPKDQERGQRHHGEARPSKVINVTMATATEAAKACPRCRVASSAARRRTPVPHVMPTTKRDKQREQRPRRRSRPPARGTGCPASCTARDESAPAAPDDGGLREELARRRHSRRCGPGCWGRCPRLRKRLLIVPSRPGTSRRITIANAGAMISAFRRCVPVQPAKSTTPATMPPSVAERLSDIGMAAAMRRGRRRPCGAVPLGARPRSGRRAGG